MLSQEGRRHRHYHHTHNKHMFDLLGIERPLFKKPPKRYTLVQMSPYPFVPPIGQLQPIVSQSPFGMPINILPATILPFRYAGGSSSQQYTVASDLVVEDVTQQNKQSYESKYTKNKQLYKKINMQLHE